MSTLMNSVGIIGLAIVALVLLVYAIGVQRLLLACTRLEFTPPASETALRIEAPLAAEFAVLLTRLGAQYSADPLSSSSP